MSIAIFVRETVDLSGATEQLLLRFARRCNLAINDTLIIAARTVTAAPNYVFSLRDPGDPRYLLNIVIFADTVAAPDLSIDVSGDAATAPGSGGSKGRSIEVYARTLQPLTAIAKGGAGAPGVPGKDGNNGFYTIEINDWGKPVRQYEPPTEGSDGSDAGPGGAGGTAIVIYSEGGPPQAVADGGPGAAGGSGGTGGKGSGFSRAPSGNHGRASSPGLAGLAITQQLPAAEVWVKALSKYADALTKCGEHWCRLGEYRSRQVRGLPTPAQADTIVGLFDLALSASPTNATAAMLRTQFLDGVNMIGLPRNLDVIPDFERYARRLNESRTWIDGLFNDAKAMVTVASSTYFTQTQLDVQIKSLDFTKNILEAERTDAGKDLAEARSALARATTLYKSAMQEVENKRAKLETPVNWGGVVVVGMSAIIGFLVSASNPLVGKIIGSIPDLMVLGNFHFATDKETKVLKEAISAGAKISGAKDAAAKKKPGVEEISILDWITEAGPIVISFAKFASDLDNAAGDSETKQLVKDLAKCLQERLSATAKLSQALRRVTIAEMRVDAVTKERAQYADIYARAGSDASLARQTALTLLRIVQHYGDIYLGYQFQAARAVEIYTLNDQSECLGMDRWQVNPDDTLNFVDDIDTPITYQSRLIASATELSILPLFSAYDTFDFSGFQPDVHFVTIDNAATLDGFRRQGSLVFTVGVNDLAGERWQAKVMAATVTLHGATASTPSFPIFVTHSGRCTDLLPDGNVVTQLLKPRSTIIQVAATAGGMAVGTAVGQPTNERSTDFWRRSIATEWTLMIEPDVIEDRKVDLTALTKVDVALSYIAQTGAP